MAGTIRREPELTLHDEMLDRAADALKSLGFEAPDIRDCAEAVIRAAFQGVPMSNHSIGTLLQFFDLVICVKDHEMASAAGVYRANGDPDGFDGLGHSINVSYGYDPDRYIKSITISGLDSPAPDEERQG
jgi:hypothetical protein